MQAKALLGTRGRAFARNLEYEGSCHARRYRLHLELRELSEGD